MANLNISDTINMNSEYGKRLSIAIESTYGFKVLEYSSIPEISFTSKKALIVTSNEIYFLKEKPLYSRTEGALFRSASFQNFCAENSDKFVKIIKTKDNKDYLLFEGSVYFITDYIKGPSFTGKIEDLLKTIDTLAELKKIGHKYIAKYCEEKEFLLINKSYEIIPSFNVLEPIIKSVDDRKSFEKLKLALNVLIKEYDANKNIKYVMSHGDCILFNFQTLTDRVILHDFDNTKVLPNVHDMCEFFVSSCLLNYRGSITNLKLPIFLNYHKNMPNTLVIPKNKCILACR